MFIQNIYREKHLYRDSFEEVAMRFFGGAMGQANVEAIYSYNATNNHHWLNSVQFGGWQQCADMQHTAIMSAKYTDSQ